MTSYAQVGVSVCSWHTGDPVDEAVALDPSICQGRYLRSCRHKMWGKGEAQRIWMAAMKDERRSQYAWRGVLRRVPQSPLTSGPPSPGDATFLIPVLVCPVPESRDAYVACAPSGHSLRHAQPNPWTPQRAVALYAPCGVARDAPGAGGSHEPSSTSGSPVARTSMHSTSV